MKPTLAYQNPSPPAAPVVAGATRAVRLMTLSERDRRHVADDAHDGPDERWPAAARLLVIAALGAASWAAVIAGLAALFR